MVCIALTEKNERLWREYMLRIMHENVQVESGERKRREKGRRIMRVVRILSFFLFFIYLIQKP